MKEVENIIIAAGSKLTDEQIDVACSSLATALKSKAKVARQMEKLREEEKLVQRNINIAKDSIRELSLGVMGI